MPDHTPCRHDDERCLPRCAAEADDCATDAMLEKIVDGVFLDLQDLDGPEASYESADTAIWN